MQRKFEYMLPCLHCKQGREDLRWDCAKRAQGELATWLHTTRQNWAPKPEKNVSSFFMSFLIQLCHTSYYHLQMQSMQWIRR